MNKIQIDRSLLMGFLTFSMFWLAACGGAATKPEPAKVESKHDEHSAGQEVEMSAEALKAARLEFAEVTARLSSGSLRVTGSVEVNQQQTQQATPLVSGRVERVSVALGDRVRAGQTLAVIASPQIAQMHGKLHEARNQTRARRTQSQARRTGRKSRRRDCRPSQTR